MYWFQFEKALRLLLKHFPNEILKKPTLFHSVRVWSYLWYQGYNEDLQIAGLLHDALEDTDITEWEIEKEFGIYVLSIVKANSKDMNLDKSERMEDIVRRCAELWEDALIVKMADIYDNFIFYSREWNIPEIERCQNLARLVDKYKNQKYIDSIFHKIAEIIQYKPT
jgi:(p)ppGpp synthase/HD superfamily hydrolase